MEFCVQHGTSCSAGGCPSPNKTTHYVRWLLDHAPQGRAALAPHTSVVLARAIVYIYIYGHSPQGPPLTETTNMFANSSYKCWASRKHCKNQCLQEMHPCIDQTRNRNPDSILMFVTLESVHLPVCCRHWSEKTLGNRPFYRGSFTPVLQNPHRDKQNGSTSPKTLTGTKKWKQSKS